MNGQIWYLLNINYSTIIICIGADVKNVITKSQTALQRNNQYPEHIRTQNSSKKLLGLRVHTSAISSVSFSPKEHVVLKAWTRSSHVVSVGTVTVTGNGKVVPLVLKTVKVIVRIVLESSGKDRYINGSNVTDNFLQTGQNNVDLYWPYNNK